MSLIEARRNRKWIGCIDFGTAMSKAAVVRRKPRTELTSADVVPLAIGDHDGMGVRSGLVFPNRARVCRDHVPHSLARP